MQRNNLPIIVIGAILGLLAIGGTIMMLLPKGPPTPPPAAAAPPPSKQIVATQDIPPRTVIRREMLREVEVPADQLTANAATNPTQLVGKLTNAPVAQGEAVSTNAVTQPLQRVLPADIPIPAGLRAVAVWVDPNQTAAGLVDVGDHVDVVVTHRLTATKEPGQRVAGAAAFVSARTIAQNLVVLAVDRSLNAPRPAPGAAAAPGAPTAPGAPPEPPPPPQPQQPQLKTRVLLAARPEIAERLVAANTDGILHLTIRNPNMPDQYRIAEAREYPTTIVSTRGAEISAKLADARVQELLAERQFQTQLRHRRIEKRLFPEPKPIRIPPVDINKFTKLPPPRPDYPTPPPPPTTKDVVVIRGTEKTLVSVPK